MTSIFNLFVEFQYKNEIKNSIGIPTLCLGQNLLSKPLSLKGKYHSRRQAVPINLRKTD